MKRMSNIEKISPICDFLQSCESPDAFIEWVTNYMMSEEERIKAVVQKAKEESKEIILEAGWTQEEI